MTENQFDALTTFIKWTDQTDGRDKAAKVVQFGSRLLAYLIKQNDKNVATKLTNLMGAIRDGRKLFRFGKEVDEYKAIITTYNSDKLPLNKALMIISRFGFINYWLWDHVNYLAKFKVLNLDPKPYAVYSANGWFFALLFQIILESINYSDLSQQQAKCRSDPSKQKEWNEVSTKKWNSQLALIRMGCDLLVAGSLAGLPEKIRGRELSEGVVASAGLIAGLIACYTNLKKAAMK